MRSSTNSYCKCILLFYIVTDIQLTVESSETTVSTSNYRDKTTISSHYSNNSGKLSMFEKAGLTDKNINATTDDHRNSASKSAVLVIRLAQCRAQCLSQKLKADAAVQVLKKQKWTKKILSSFNDCWDTCLLLEIESGSNHPSLNLLLDVVCSSSASVCLPGCQEACKFHHYLLNEFQVPLLLNPDNFLPYNFSIIPLPGNPLQKNKTRTTKKKKELYHVELTWHSVLLHNNSANESNNDVVYTIVEHAQLKGVSGWTWKMIVQTIKNSISLTFGEKPQVLETIRVFATTPKGLVHHHHHQALLRTQKVNNSIVAAAPGGAGFVGGGGGGDVKGKLIKVDDPHLEDQEQKETVVETDVWHLRKVSVVHKRFLVLVEMTWDIPLDNSVLNDTTVEDGSISGEKALSKAISENQMNELGEKSSESRKKKLKFLLTWELIGGALQGNMITDVNRATLSLHHNSSYSIQIGLVDHKTAAEIANNSTLNQLPQLISKVYNRSPATFVNTSEGIPPQMNSAGTEVGLNHDQDSLDDYTDSIERTDRTLTADFSESSPVAYPFLGPLEDYDFDDTTGATRYECPSGESHHACCCKSSMASWLEIFGSTYGFFILLFIALYLLYLYKNWSCCPQMTKNQGKNLLKKRSPSSACLLEQQEMTAVQLPGESDENVGTLSQYNIV